MNTYDKQGRKQYYKRRGWLDSLKADIPCADCGNIYEPFNMDWHHVDEKSETTARGSSFKWGWPKERILAEIAKCVLLCALCHRRRHYQRGG